MKESPGVLLSCVYEVRCGRIVDQFGYVEVLAGLGDEVGRGEAFQAEDDAVGGQDGDAGRIHVDEGHHHGSFGEGRRGYVAGADALVGVAGLVQGQLELRGTLLGIGDGGFVAVVAIGDDELLVRHSRDDEVDQIGVGDLPDAVDYAVLVGDGEVRGGGSFASLPPPKISLSAIKPGSE